ncbi:uncharacterized protein LOC128746023 [Sabethes cyaneus]|uniref:uncharacterized protein LOC128746023 n=1 Tax=Sabethes cyaneus TaxID=53552 RepID=UPI00237DD414|nr:uncharacterized protein LOC128746023 [Sabethes cyaneus]
MSEKKMKQKELKRRNIIDSIRRIDEFLQNYDPDRDSQEVAIRMSRLDTLMETFESIQAEYETFDDTDEFIHLNTATRAKVEEQYFRVKGGLMSLVPPAAPVPIQPVSTVPIVSQFSGAKLPTISLPQFDGDLNDWLTFHDSFNSLIHSASEIPCIQKFQYLRSALKGDALKLIESLTITANNYAVAWESLLNRYSNKYLLKKKHLQAITSQPKPIGKSISSLRVVVEEFQRHVKILEQLNEPTAHWSSLLVQLLCTRVDEQTLKDWEEFISADGDPTYTNLIEFLTKKIRTMESLSINADYSVPSTQNKHHFPVKHQRSSQGQPSSRIGSFAATENCLPACHACEQRHFLVKCPVFEKMSLKDKLQLVNTKKICSNCFRRDHFVRKCASKYACQICQRRHHTLLHPGFETTATVIENPNHGATHGQLPQHCPSSNVARCEIGTVPAATDKIVSTNSVSDPRSINVFLSTVVLIVLDRYGREHLARAILDSASQCCLMSERLSQRLNLPQRRLNQPIFGVGESKVRATGLVSTEVRSRIGKFAVQIDCLILPKITTMLPAVTVKRDSWTIPEGIDLADPNFNVSQKIDLIIGAEHFCTFLKGGRIDLGKSYPMLIESEFGWLVTGISSHETTHHTPICNISTLESLDRNIEKFWRIEELHTKVLSPTEQMCEDFFRDTVSRDNSGRYIVKYPKREDIFSKIGDSYSNALRRLESLERKLDRNEQLKERYHTFMSEFINLGHMREISQDEKKSLITCYLPHHPVVKESSTTTKVRGVFDASAKTSTGYSLNDALLVGPVIQDELYTIILRFRRYRIVLLADIEKMYRMIKIHPDDQFLQCVLFRFNKNHPVTEYVLTTVTYGLAPSSFLATRSLCQLAEDEGHLFPLAAKALKRDFYMDDFIRGEDSVESAIKLRREMSELLMRGGFRLRKFCSNSHEVLNDIPEEDLATQSDRTFDPEQTIKTLGISWEPSTDQFRFEVNVNMKDAPITKRHILSIIARLYDPLGLIAPIIVRAKIVMQQLWTLSLDWDEEVPAEIQTIWISFISDLPQLAEFRIERYAFETGDVQLHCLADASDVAYGACVYVRSDMGYGRIKVELLTSKSRVAPLKKRSIPRLELCAAKLAAQLVAKVGTALEIRVESIWCWSDSTVVLFWLRSPSPTWKTFVSNRVAEIQILTHGSKWRHVPGAENPADLVSRGMTVQQIIKSELWRHGPEWLQKDKTYWPEFQIPLAAPSDEILERKVTSLAIRIPPPPNPLITRFSLYHRMVRSIAYCLRFIKNSRKGTRESTIVLSLEEVKHSQTTLVKLVQAECYPNELRVLRRGQSVANQSTLKLLNPFVDSSGIIRVGGRLRLSNQPYETKHPILLPGTHHFTRLLLVSYHRKLLHGGISHTLAAVRNDFWPTCGRRAVRSTIWNCYRCTRADPRPIKQPVGQIPSPRITPSRPFASVGVDYCGPVYIKSRIRKGTAIKAYVAIFVCFCTKAVHIELVGDLTTVAFLSALRRFMARRGTPEHIYSDNATNFAGAKHELHALYQMLKPSKQNSIATNLATMGIQWHMIPPRAPNFGGLWEAAVKVAKRHLLRQVGASTLLQEDLETVLVQIEGCMNSRPLTALSDDPNDLRALTPGHFLVGSSLLALPDPDLREVPTNHLSRYQFLQQKLQHFWYRWTSEYLKELQRQATVNPRKVDLKVDQVVILQDHQLPPIRWPLARIMELHPGQDGVVRVATVRTEAGIFKRPTSKLCLLPSALEGDNNKEETNLENKLSDLN